MPCSEKQIVHQICPTLAETTTFNTEILAKALWLTSDEAKSYAGGPPAWSRITSSKYIGSGNGWCERVRRYRDLATAVRDLLAGRIAIDTREESHG